MAAVGLQIKYGSKKINVQVKNKMQKLKKMMKYVSEKIDTNYENVRFYKNGTLLSEDDSIESAHLAENDEIIATIHLAHRNPLTTEQNSDIKIIPKTRTESLVEDVKPNVLITLPIESKLERMHDDDSDTCNQSSNDAKKAKFDALGEPESNLAANYRLELDVEQFFSEHLEPYNSNVKKDELKNDSQNVKDFTSDFRKLLPNEYELHVKLVQQQRTIASHLEEISRLKDAEKTLHSGIEQCKRELEIERESNQKLKDRFTAKLQEIKGSNEGRTGQPIKRKCIICKEKASYCFTFAYCKPSCKKTYLGLELAKTTKKDD